MTDYPKFASITAKGMETVQERRTRASERASEGEGGLVGDKKERKKRTFVHTLYLRSGG